MKIKELTKDQQARFPEFIEKWTRIGLCTEPAANGPHGARLTPAEKIQGERKIMERLVDTKTACRKLGVGSTYMTTVKREMGILHRKRFLLSDVLRHIQSRLQRPQDHQPATVGNSDELSCSHDREAA